MSKVEKQNWKIGVKKVKEEVAAWRVFLNNTIGVLSFGFGLGCLGTSKPKIYALISLAFVMFLTFTGIELFPVTIKKLREKKNKTEIEEMWLKGLEKHFFGPRVLIMGYIVYLFGFAFLSCIAAGYIK